ncbi:DUF4136 domain-containing protein [Dyadobacter frigoris]|uniref:DUF4136 domain-containing protein n=1 Tax=Dyadobacter frigoris TaxID=2576211 RepID=A0A4V6BHW7_9BACT|nr:DUF4136 domain-containing protein [Dyadobacter frigoris]TKT87993.1 DUF4136 domain-containing protein [Dyadobacter frigoris]GLU52892.1 hypothetical protein Dfri01_23530 [Dyadobacter frigoris]
MIKYIKYSILAWSLFLASCSAGYHSLKTSKETDFTISDYSTFGFQHDTVDSDSLPEPFFKNIELIKNAIADNLVSKGLRESQDPVLMINLSARMGDKVQTRQTDFRTDGLPRYTGQRRYSWKSEEVPVGKYKVGTLFLDISETRQDKQVWRGEIENILPGKETKIQTQLVKAVDDLLDRIK